MSGAATLQDVAERHEALGEEAQARRNALVMGRRVAVSMGAGEEQLERFDVRTDPELQRIRSSMRALEEDQARVANANQRIEARMTTGSGLIGQATRESLGATEAQLGITREIAPPPPINVGTVNVSVDGSTDMTAPEVSAAVAEGVESGRSDPSLTNPRCFDG